VFVFFLLKISVIFKKVKKKRFGSEIITYALSLIIVLKYLWENINK